ncbi:site-specific integrase [Mesorhizobium abyssinicae]|uniref:Site-specific integrase n=1 Tax=Mesorhizobium abyssinicae TaxID=1209958 RepID=A0ABU5ATR1_9HYPH|nr:site-specific integrase [Mesorhizobium abyssinicae]MDX8540705.1 site-specific integrase [Mesorhizobium abyssinicae]
MITWLLADVIRRAGLKPLGGKPGPRVHDLGHSVVVNRILEWYRTGINPQDRLPFLATYLGHRDINSTLVYITVTQELLHYANDRFPNLMRAFFYEWLIEQRNASIHTVRSYRDTWRLLLRFVAQRTGTKVALITLADLGASEVAAFLSHAEHDCGGTIGTRNCRLAAIRSFFHFVATRESIAQCVQSSIYRSSALRCRNRDIWILRK